MNKELNKLKERFEVEIWLYIDGSLSEKDHRFWDDQISKHRELKNYYDEVIGSLQFYKENSSEELSDEAFNLMLQSIKKPSSIGELINSFFEIFFSNNFLALKAVVAATLAVVALVILLTTEKPNAVKSISEDILSWHGETINRDLNAVDESIETLSMKEWEKYELIKANYDEWEQSYFILNKEIESMQNDLEETSL